MTNRRLGETIVLDTKSKGQRTTFSNNEPAIWHFLNSISYETEKMLMDNISIKIPLFDKKYYEDKTDGNFITITGINARNFTLNTGNLVGSVKYSNYSLKISSRFGDAFLKYIIADANGFLELENMGSQSDDNGYEWLLAYLWNIKFKKAYRYGIPKTYISKNERISRVRGAIDAMDYFQNKVSGKYRCSYREQSYTSSATSLFIKAYETVQHYAFCQPTRRIYNAFLMANQGVKRSYREILKTPYFTNPIYQDYNALIDLSKQIIKQKNSDLNAHNLSSAFLFDISMLFEYFIRKIIIRHGIRLLNKFDQTYEIPVGAFGDYRRKLEPDLIIDSDNGLYVFDVKYKSFDPRFGANREDIFQLHTYIGQCGNIRPVKGCGFIYPLSEDNWRALDLGRSNGLISDIVHQQTNKIPFFILFLKIPATSENNLSLNSPSFAEIMSNSCANFLSCLDALLKQKNISAN